ncbi:hypothetical protein REPUB_Repub02eG0199100 [Reevesia pubescens]
MEVRITSREMVKPSSPEVHLLKPFKLSLLDQKQNQLLPCQPFCFITNSTVPQLAIQVTIFDCGGIAVAVCVYHKIIDASTVSAFLKSWAAFNRGCNGEIPNPDLLEASSRVFPPIESKLLNTGLEGRLSCEGGVKTRRFVFDANSIATLMFKAKSKRLEHPSRVVAVSAFVLKYAIQASRSASGTLKPAILTQPVNIRQKLKPKLPDYSIGNLFLLPITTYNSVEKDIELHDLAYLVKEGAESVTSDYLDLLQGEERFRVIGEQFIKMVETASKGNAQYYSLVSWLNTLEGKDFGWGKPTLFSIPGVDRHNREFGNLIILKGTGKHKAIEAWVTLSEKEMAFLEHDPEFLAFASPNPHYDKIKI